jgi:hypothetical protein
MVTQAVGIPTEGVQASFSCFGVDQNSEVFTFGRAATPISPGSDYDKTVDVPAGFDGMLTLNITNESGVPFADYSSVSLAVLAMDNELGVPTEVVLGAEHIIFDSNPRVARILQKFSETSQDFTQKGFFFRDNIGDTAIFPHNGNASQSPGISLVTHHCCPRLNRSLDIQPLGTVPDSNVNQSLGPNNYNVDVSSQRQIAIQSGSSNYVYLRGTTNDNVTGNVRLFLIPAGTLLHPSQYGKPENIVWDYNESGDPIVAQRPYSATSLDTVPLLVEKPFLLTDVLSPPPGSDHYCFIAEAKPDGTDASGQPYDWPHAQTGDFATAPEFAAWVLSTPYVAWRNVTYVTNPSGDTQVFRSGFTIPGK